MLADPGAAARLPPMPRRRDWSSVSAGPWLADTLKALRAPDGAGVDPGAALRGTLRPYQKAGVQWLHLLSGLGLGACLADDMGLGKTIQVLALLLVQRQRSKGAMLPPCLLVAPASLLANWAAEIERFAPDLRDANPAPVGDDGRRGKAVHAGGRGKARSGDHQLRHAAAHAGAWPRSHGGC